LLSRFTWEEEIRLRMPDVPVTRMYVLTKTNEQFIDPAVVITSYDLMTKKKEMLLNFKFGIAVFVRCGFLDYRILFLLTKMSRYLSNFFFRTKVTI